MHSRNLLGWIAVSMCILLPAISAAEGDAPVMQTELMVIFDGPLWPHGAYTGRVEGKTFGPPAMTVVMTVSHEDAVRFQPKDGVCVIVQMLPKVTSHEALALDVDLLECPSDTNAMGKTRHPGTASTNIPLILKQSAAVRYDDKNQVRLVTQRFIRAGD